MIFKVVLLKTDGQTAIKIQNCSVVDTFPYFMSNLRHIFCLQIEPSDDSTGNDASYVLNNSNDIIADGSMPAVKQVSSFSYIV